MPLTLEILLNILAGGAFLIYWSIAFVMLYHLSRFGIGTQPKKFAALFLFGSVVLSAAAIIFYMNTDISVLLDNLPRQTT